MSQLETMLKHWSNPARSTERAQLTLRIPLFDHQRLMALKEVFPNRSVNDMVVDILEAALNDLVEKLPTFTYTKEDAERQGEILSLRTGGEVDASDLADRIGEAYGPAVDYREALALILEESNSNKEAVA